MKVETVINGGVTLVISPENQMEEQALKQLANQNNEITEIRSGAMVLNRTFNSGIVIGKKTGEETPPKPADEDEE